MKRNHLYLSVSFFTGGNAAAFLPHCQRSCLPRVHDKQHHTAIKPLLHLRTSYSYRDKITANRGQNNDVGRCSFVNRATSQFLIKFNKILLQIKRILVHCHRRTTQQLLASLFLSLALILPTTPLKSNAASTVGSNINNSASHKVAQSVEYYLQNDPCNRSFSTSSSSRAAQQQSNILSIQTSSQPSSLVASPSRRNSAGVLTKNNRPERKTTQGIASALVVASLAAASIRAKLRKTRVVRTATPFGRMRNTSPLGNGVSVIRLRMVFDLLKQSSATTVDDNGACDFLEKLQTEEYNLYATIAMLTQQQQQQIGLDVYQLRQKSLVRYLFNVISILNNNKQYIKYGSMVSTRVPFVEDAVKEYTLLSESERVLYGKSNERQISPLSSASNGNYQSIRELKKAATTDQQNGNANQKFVVASILLAIKGDHTTSPFSSGIYTKKDIGRALIRIGTDATMDSCLVGTEIMWMPRELDSRRDVEVVVTESDILKKFSDVIPLS